jgi:hypothetical protein
MQMGSQEGNCLRFHHLFPFERVDLRQNRRTLCFRKETTGKTISMIRKLRRLLAEKCRNTMDAFTGRNECNRLLAL